MTKTIRDSQKAGVSLAEFTAGWADLVPPGLHRPQLPSTPRGTLRRRHIPEQIRMVQALVEKGHAYVSEDGSVYFRISSFPEYGKLSTWMNGNWIWAKPQCPVQRG